MQAFNRGCQFVTVYAKEQLIETNLQNQNYDCTLLVSDWSCDNSKESSHITVRHFTALCIPPFEGMDILM